MPEQNGGFNLGVGHPAVERRAAVWLQASSLLWQEASWLLSQSKELMEVVLRNPGLQGLQREGGAILARLQQDADRLPFHPDVRYTHIPFPRILLLSWALELMAGRPRS